MRCTMAHTFNTTKQHYLRDTILTVLLRVLELHLIYKYIKHITATKDWCSNEIYATYKILSNENKIRFRSG